jgi:GntR family phosphonate transport system transcriptional regulator
MVSQTVTRSNQEAVYLRISRTLEEEICRNYKSGEFLPAEHILADRFHVNRHTLRRAIDELVDAGIVERRRGRGTMVLDPAINYPISSRTRFTENLEFQGKHTGTVVLNAAIIPATKGVAKALDQLEDSLVICLDLLRTVDGWPFIISSNFFPLPRFDGLEEKYKGGSLHDLLDSAYGVQPHRASSIITAVMPKPEDAHALKVPRNRPLLRIKSINHDADGVPVEYVVTRARSDRVQLEVNP